MSITLDKTSRIKIDIHSLPCSIKHSGSANVSKYFVIHEAGQRLMNSAGMNGSLVANAAANAKQVIDTDSSIEMQDNDEKDKENENDMNNNNHNNNGSNNSSDIHINHDTENKHIIQTKYITSDSNYVYFRGRQICHSQIQFEDGVCGYLLRKKTEHKQPQRPRRQMPAHTQTQTNPARLQSQNKNTNTNKHSKNNSQTNWETKAIFDSLHVWNLQNKNRLSYSKTVQTWFKTAHAIHAPIALPSDSDANIKTVIEI